MGFIAELLGSAGFMPHGHCFLWSPGLLWTYVASDLLIALAYYSIPVALFTFARRRVDLPFTAIFAMFALFIFACGTTHLIAIWNIWQPVYWLDAGVKLITAGVSVVTAIVLWPLVPKALSLPSPRQLAQSNLILESEIAERRAIEAELHEANRSLEQRVRERTAELETTNAELKRQIDERIEAERALRDSQRLLQAFADNMTAVLWVKDLDGRYLLISGNYEEIFHLPREAIIGKADAELFPSEQATMFRAVDQQAISSGQALQAEELAVIDGREVVMLSVKCPLFDDHGKLYALGGMSTDITVWKRAEQALATERTLLRTLIDALPDVVFTKDMHGRFTMCNAAELRNLGLSSENELIGKTVFDFYPPALAKRYHADDLLALSGETVINREEPGLDAERNERWFLTIKVPLKDKAGHVTGLVGMSHDITERRRQEESQHRAQKLEALGTLAGGVAHDFNNILLAISGNAKLATSDLALDHPVQESLGEITKAAARATDLVRRILTFTRGQEARRVPTQLGPLVDEALKLLRPTLPAMITIDVLAAPDLPPIAADASQIHQILMNLATNAAQAIGDHAGTIEIRLEAVEVKHEMMPKMPDVRPGRYVRMTVADDGSGIDQAIIDRIFDPFFTTKPLGEGSGLGLSVVHGIVRSHEGAVTVYSAPGSGTAFKVYFPALSDALPEAPAVVRESARSAGERVLYVDDEAALVLLVTRLLRRLGYDVTAFEDPREALAAFQAAPQSFDVVVTDLAMPHLSGFDLANALMELRPDVPVLMTSGYVRAADQQTAQQIGIRALILKPNTVEELTQELDRLFAERRSAKT